MLGKVSVVLACLAAVCYAASIPAVIEFDDNGEISDVIISLASLDEPDNHNRAKRQVQMNKQVGPGTAFGKLDFPQSGGVMGTGGYTAPITPNLQGTAQASKMFGVPNGPTNVGGRLDWTGNKASAGLGVDHMMHGPTTVDLGGKATLWQPNRNTDLSAHGSYSRQFGPGAFPKPNYNVGATFSHRF